VVERATDTGWRWLLAVSSDAEADDAVVRTAEEWVERDVEWDAGPSTLAAEPIWT
jgi:hypothetical protein